MLPSSCQKTRKSRRGLVSPEQSVSSNPKKAREAFTALVISIQREREDERRARERRLAELLAEQDEDK